jgi:hypothetical protein
MQRDLRRDVSVKSARSEAFRPVGGSAGGMDAWQMEEYTYHGKYYLLDRATSAVYSYVDDKTWPQVRHVATGRVWRG